MTYLERLTLDRTLPGGVWSFSHLHLIAAFILSRPIGRGEFRDYVDDYYRRHPGEPGTTYGDLERSTETPKGWKRP